MENQSQGQNQIPMTPPPPQVLVEPIVLQCKSCKFTIAGNFYFCPNCGKKIKEPPFKFSWVKSISIIIFSILFPPLGIIPGIKYILKEDNKARIIGIIAIMITIIITGLLIILTMNFINSILKTYNEIMQIQNAVQNPNLIQNQEELLNQIKILQQGNYKL